MTSTTSLRATPHLVVFGLVAVLSGWMGYGLDKALGNPPEQQFGMLLWIVLPLLTTTILRIVSKEGWKDAGLRLNFKGNGRWYAVSAFAFPVIAAVVLAIGGALGFISFTGFSVAGLLAVFAMGLVPAFIKNIFEEFSWRGYLAPKVTAAGLTGYTGHILVGCIWGLWHLPYWLFYLGNAQIQAATGMSLVIFIPIALLNILVASVVYGEIRQKTGSVWPAMLMHTVGNAAIEILIAQKFVEIQPGLGLFFNPSSSLLTFILMAAIGVGIKKAQTR